MSQQHLSRTLLSVAVSIGGGVVVLMGLCYGSGLALDPHMEITTERTLEASPDAVAPLITSAEGAVTWWQHAGEMHGENRISERITVEAVDGGVVFKAGEQIFEEWALLEASEHSATWSIDFKSAVATRTLTVEPVEAGTRMVWHEAVEIDSPVMRWMAQLPQQNVIANFQSAMQIAEAAAQAHEREQEAAEAAPEEAAPTDEAAGTEAGGATEGTDSPGDPGE